MLKFGKLFRGERESEPEEQEGQEAFSEETVPVKVPEEVPAQEETYRIEPYGDLKELWIRWKEDENVPVLSLTDERGSAMFHMDGGALERERLRMELKLEKTAKSRVQSIRSVEEKGNTAALNAECKCLVSKDKQAAWLFVFPQVGYGDPLQESQVRDAVGKEKITVGLDEDAIKKSLDPAHYFELIPVAVGIPAVEGENGRIVEYFPREVARDVVIREDDTADYRAQCYMQVIAEDDVICDIIPPVPGEEGKRIDGSVVKPRGVKAARVPKGSGTKFSDDGMHLLSDKDGHLEFRQDNFNVVPVLDVAGDVDYSTGNLNFPGDIHIGGDVRDGFTVVAEGSLMIDGLVEAAEVTAGGDLIITKGVVGDRRAVLRCGGSLRTKFLENCTAYAGNSIYSDCSVNCRLCCDEAVTVTNGHGSIIGGSVTAGVMVKAKLLGARSGRLTELTLGVQPYKQLLEQGQESGEEENSPEDAVSAREAPLTDGGERELDRLECGTAENDQNGENKAEEKSKFSVDLNRCRVECDTVYPITTITVGGTALTVNTVRNAFKISYDKKIGEFKELV